MTRLTHGVAVSLVCERLDGALAPRGRLVLVMHPPGAGAAQGFAERVATSLPAAGLRVGRVLRDQVAGAPAVAVMATI